MKTIRVLALLLIVSQWLVACSVSDSMNKIVQNGGTILIGLGSHEELGHVNLSAADLTATLTDVGSAQVDVTVREVFPLNVDKTSDLNHRTELGEDGYSGFWFAVIDLVDPNSGLATNLADGAAMLEIQGLGSSVSQTLNILPGPGSINPIMAAGGLNTLSLLRPADQVKYTVNDPQVVFTEQNLLGAIEFRFEYPTIDVDGLQPAQWPRGVTASNNEHLQIQSYTRSEAGTNTLHVVVLNPAGIGAVSAQSAATPAFYQASKVRAVRFSVVYPPQLSAAQFASVNEVTGYGIDGAEMNIDDLVITTPAI
ncbi:Uncharacterised protein [Halioglobus japonicus]|nr:Uncharacterised protein [Halioglobus japonicus]